MAYTSIVSTVVANANDQANSPIKIKEHHCVKSVRLWSYSTPYLSVFCPNEEKHGPEKTLYLDFFQVVQKTMFFKD